MEKDRSHQLNNEQLLTRLREAIDAGITGDELARLKDEIVRRNVGLVKSIALEFTNSGEELEDLIQAGYIGLLNAVANFDLSRKVRFSTYASHLIRGEIRHYIRDKHAPVHVPQWVQAMNRRVTEAEEEFFKQEGRPPTLQELAARVGVDEKQLVEILRGREAMTYVSIDEKRRAEDPNPAVPSIDHFITEKEDGLPLDVRIRIVAAIERLGELQRRVVEGIFYQGKSQAEVGKDLGISQRQVSRMKEAALRALRDKLEPKKDAE
jgi:RNA polymerase sigma-B factor